MDLEVTRSVLSRIYEEARAGHPFEVCGVLLGVSLSRIDAILPAQNVALDALRHFEIQSETLISAHVAERRGGKHVIGYYHSHPEGGAWPSTIDREQAAHDGRVWAICGVGAGGQQEIGWFLDLQDAFQPLSYRTVEG